MGIRENQIAAIDQAVAEACETGLMSEREIMTRAEAFRVGEELVLDFAISGQVLAWLERAREAEQPVSIFGIPPVDLLRAARRAVYATLLDEDK